MSRRRAYDIPGHAAIRPFGPFRDTPPPETPTQALHAGLWAVAAVTLLALVIWLVGW